MFSFLNDIYPNICSYYLSISNLQIHLYPFSSRLPLQNAMTKPLWWQDQHYHDGEKESGGDEVATKYHLINLIQKYKFH